MKKIILFFCLIVFGISKAQNDTIVNYLDKNKKRVQPKELAYYTQYVVEDNAIYTVVLYNYKGELISIENFSNKRLDTKIGEQRHFHFNGKLSSIRTYDNQSRLHGKSLSFYSDGSKNMVGVNKNDQRHGLWNFYYKKGNKIARLIYDKGKILKYKLWDENGNTKNEKLILERKPKFKKGGNSLNKYLQRKLTSKFNYSNITGNLILKFKINREGKPTDIQIFPDNLPEKYKKHIYKIFKNMPNWEPGIQLNRKVTTKFTLPIKLD